MTKRVGRKSASQTPAPKSDKIYGSKNNPKGSASSEKTAKSIKLSEQTEKVLKNKLSEFKEEHPNKKSVTLSDLKAVYRRGSGAYSNSHRPTITGGAPNSRAAWSYARVNKFLKKAGGAKVKAAYVQDDDLFAKGGKTKGGDCYVKAGSFCLLPNSYDFIGEPYLVHAEVRGQGKIEGLRYGHAWVEDDENVYDFSNGREIIMPKQIYYYFGDIKTDNPKKYQRYTFPEARAKMLKTKHYGSWDIETEYADGGEIYKKLKKVAKVKNSDFEKEKISQSELTEILKKIGKNKNFITYANQKGRKNYILESFDEYSLTHGFCNPLSYFLMDMYEGLSVYSGKNEKDGNHLFLKLGDKYFDAKNVDGVKNPKDLDFFTDKKITIKLLESNDLKQISQNYYDYINKPESERSESENLCIMSVESAINDYADGGLIAPNGNKSNLTPTQYKLVRTPQFKAWFGDWENDPQNASKVVDENGEPMVVYHGTENVWWDKNFVFNPQFEGKSNNVIRRKFGGTYFTSNKAVASTYGVNIVPVFLNFRNPLTIDANNKNIFDIDELKKIEYNEDVIVKNTNDTGQFGFGMSYSLISDIYITTKIFGAIKIADGTNTTFDINDPDIRYSKGGKTYNDKELLSKWKKGESIGFTGEAHLKAKGLIPRADGTKRKSEKYMADGGQTSQEIECVNCGWKWETADSDENDMYVCHQCGFDNTLYYTNIMSKLKKPMSVSEISREHGVDEKYIDNQLDIGIKHELEHTTDEGIARIIALHHIGEKPNYYELVEKYKLEDGGQPSKFWHKAEKYEIVDFIQNERNATKELLCSSDTRISKAIICRAKIDFCEKKERNTNNLEIKNAWSEVKNIWEDCLFEVKNGVVYEFNDGGECGCASKSSKSKEYKDGGLAYGNSHDKGGMPLKVQSTGQNIEIEGGEGVINKRSMQMKKRIDFEGKKLTPCQIVSKINEMGGGVKFKCEDVEVILEKDGSF